MANVAHEPVKRAMSRIRELSADEETRRLAFVRERALRDEVSFLNDAKREGHHEGVEGTLRKLINLKFGELPDWADERLASSTDDQLDNWVAQILTAESLEALLGKH